MTVSGLRAMSTWRLPAKTSGVVSLETTRKRTVFDDWLVNAGLSCVTPVLPARAASIAATADG